MQIGTAEHAYEWIDGWAELPEAANGRTHGIATTGDGDVVVFRQADPAVLVYDADGTLRESWGDRFGGAHGLTLVEEDGEPRLWLTDQESAAVVETTLDGTEVARLDPPAHPAYEDGEFVPTWVAVTPTGDVWVADGYGEEYVHRYDADGDYRDSIDGEEGAGRFDCPHGISVDDRGPEPALYVADRGNARFQVYDLDGSFDRVVGEDALTSPCGVAFDGDELVVPELFARVTILDADGDAVCYLGENESAVDREAWPNLPDEALEAGLFNSPHDAAVDADGNLYVAEWITGGRVTKLERV